jgi:hypothetical protein
VYSTNITLNLLNRAEFFPAFLERLKQDPDAVVKQFEAFRRSRAYDSSLGCCLPSPLTLCLLQ